MRAWRGVPRDLPDFSPAATLTNARLEIVGASWIWVVRHIRTSSRRPVVYMPIARRLRHRCVPRVAPSGLTVGDLSAAPFDRGEWPARRRNDPDVQHRRVAGLARARRARAVA